MEKTYELDELFLLGKGNECALPVYGQVTIQVDEDGAEIVAIALDSYVTDKATGKITQSLFYLDPHEHSQIYFAIVDACEGFIEDAEYEYCQEYGFPPSSRDEHSIINHAQLGIGR